MESSIDNLIPKVEKMSEFFRFNRKSIKEEIVSELSEIDNEIVKQKSKISFLSDKLTQQTEVNVQLNDQNIQHKKDQQQFEELDKTFNFVSSLLSAKASPHNGLETFISIFNDDFLGFANEASSLAEEAKALLLLQAIMKELELIAYYPITATKNIIAIGGGFSSGKSEFISSFFIDDCIKLPIGLEPVTAIATYVVADKENKILGFSNKGGSIEIEAKLYESLSHKFVKSFDFNLKDIMPFMTIGTPLDQELFENICLIDTPGYDPAHTDGFTQDDKDTAFEFISQAHSLIWMISIDNGTITSPDLNFLKTLDIENKGLYIVINKADGLSQKNIENIVDLVADILDDDDIEFEGISAYSSTEKQEYYFLKTSLVDFLKEENFSISTERKILFDLNIVIDMYRNAIQKDIENQKNIQKSISSLKLDVLQYSGSINDEMERKFNKSIDLLNTNFSHKNFDTQLKELNRIHLSMENTIKIIFDDLINPK